MDHFKDAGYGGLVTDIDFPVPLGCSNDFMDMGGPAMFGEGGILTGRLALKGIEHDVKPLFVIQNGPPFVFFQLEGGKVYVIDRHGNMMMKVNDPQGPADIAAKLDQNGLDISSLDMEPI
ncbi:hypothetical protein FLONG3_2865 [Fusarium longipes]|uniref:Uncharacterized protein n=1 Tax=Fusarium longipes TaxID=694270 RepID=A0A395T3I4_9HYPO|nr:hypothetical protein FLONG3_2865 [Fusarium longipes]